MLAIEIRNSLQYLFFLENAISWPLYSQYLLHTFIKLHALHEHCTMHCSNAEEGLQNSQCSLVCTECLTAAQAPAAAS